MTTYRTIRYERHEDVGTLTLARPEKHNAQHPLMWQELARVGAELAVDETLRCLVVAGDGPSFSSGIDLGEGIAGILAELSDRPSDQRTLQSGLGVAGTFAWIPRLSCPSVAAVQGHAYGAGLQLALSCDFRIFATSARVGLIETRFGILPDMGATVRLPRIVGESRARELILLGEVIDAPEALRMGMANRVVEDEELASTTTELAKRLAEQPPLAVQGARRAIDAAWHQDPDVSFRVAVEEQIRCLASHDFKEARQAMGAGRTPEWQGR